MIPVAEPELRGNELAYVTECIETEWISSLGKYVGMFEERMAELCQRKYALSVCNGTAALHLALEALGIGKGDEVIVPSLTFVATANAVSYTGATPVFVDSEPVYWQIDPALIEEAITPRTRAIIPVDLYSHPADYDAIQDIADRHDLLVVEDAAEALGVTYKGRPCGSFGDISCFSFYGNKVITTGEGGMVLTDDGDQYEHAKLLRDHAMSPSVRYYHEFVGYNYRITNIQAAIGLAQLERLNEFIEIRLRTAARYDAQLAGVPGLALQRNADYASNIYWMYSVLVEPEFPLSRDETMAALRERGVDTRPFFVANHTLPCHPCDRELPVAEDLGKRGINLPSSTKLTEEQIDYVCQQLAELAG